MTDTVPTSSLPTPHGELMVIERDTYVVKMTASEPESYAPAYTIKFQSGPIRENGVNGIQVEDLLQVCIERIKQLNQPPFNCRENSLAITDLESAQNWLTRRTYDRIRRGVEGTNVP